MRVNSTASKLDSFLQRLSQPDQFTLGVVGLGYVGLPLILRAAEAGLRTLGLDIDPAKVDDLQAGRSYIKHIGDARVQTALGQGLQATTDFARAGEADALLICVPTPLTRSREPDLSFVISTLESLLPALRPGQLVALESTTYPGTTEEELRPRIEAQGLRVGEDVFLVYSPEREDPGNPQFNTRTIPKIVGGSSAACLSAGEALYRHLVDEVVSVSSTRAAEMTKLMENIHRAVNIGLVNEMKIAADRMGLDIHEIISAAATKPFGFVAYRPGPGLGGHCIPIDPFYLTWKAREYGVHTRFIELAGEINSAMPAWVMHKISAALNDQGKPVRGSRVLVLGLAYKKNIDDLRHSPSVEILELLREQGADFAYSDPYVPVFPRLREHRFDLRHVEPTAQELARADAVVIATDHDDFDYAAIRTHARLIIDTRGRYSEPAAHIIAA
ncbi:UDP-glucose/GDP-mannose dehydrogenase [Oceanococcus atlanticus]|uniref:UDP-glucose/GDP-mannose dehydrogenase n=1 Tax=Oceanococcus atlanticus TaxID=1317117 RepID=A0A1Y1SDD7_9GAMM|nr:nucleotide sugar dehydrogenase [Oceanococcus atlanticus]ORE86941.1 UDP-glucose/GDP-mannose dehydrogenase [Oceanococcus atlanticus]RZO83698.1 MAG: nucleotide sugar dehydrogenase [Oceanococcus sp.]